MTSAPSSRPTYSLRQVIAVLSLALALDPAPLGAQAFAPLPAIRTDPPPTDSFINLQSLGTGAVDQSHVQELSEALHEMAAYACGRILVPPPVPPGEIDLAVERKERFASDPQKYTYQEPR